MRALWDDTHDLPEACDNTLLIAERCDVSFTEGNGTYMPRFPVPAGETEDVLVRSRRSRRGLQLRYPGGIPDERPRAGRLRGRRHHPDGLPAATSWWSPTSSTGPRTTASGSARAAAPAPARSCAYAMRITDLDPLEHGLIFERFLNPERVSMPDFDIDFDERRRGEVIRYVTEKYGDDRVAQIVTYGTIKAKQAVKDSARVLGYPFAMGDRITKAMPPPVMGKDIPLSEIFDPDAQALRRGRRVPRALRGRPRRQARSSTPPSGIEGLKRQWGVHAAGVIMSSEPLLDVIPIMKRRRRTARSSPSSTTRPARRSA